MSLSLDKTIELIALRDNEKLTWQQLTSYFKGYSANALRKTYYRNLESITKPAPNKPGPKVLIFDLETAPLESYTWGLFDQNIGLEMIKTDWSILSFSAKWLGSPESEIMYKDNRGKGNPRDDKDLLVIMHSLLNEADCVLVQNGARFDVPKINARFILNGMSPPTSYRIIDTLRIAKRHFGFTSNKLAYMTDKLCTKYKKLDHSEFPGFSLWKECLADNPKAWECMQRYNSFDVLSLEELYYKLAPWDRTISFAVFNEELTFRCSCGNDQFDVKGHIFTNAGKFERHVCTVCSKEYKDSTNLLTKEKRKSLKK